MAVNEKILVRGVNWVGDAVMTTPALRAIRKAHPGTHISLLVRPGIAPLFEQNPDIDEIILYSDRFRGVFGRLRLAWHLRKKRFTKAILLQNAFDAALVVFLAGIPQRIGYDRDGRKLLLTKAVQHRDLDRRVHHVNYYLNLLKEAGIEASYSEPNLRLTIEEKMSARRILSEMPGPILGINPGAAFGSAKRWLPERFAEVASWFVKETLGSVVIFGGENDASTAERIFRQIPMNKMSLAGRTSMRELMAYISECDVFLTNDSGPMHIASAAGTPLVAIFGSTSPELTGPSGASQAVLKADMDCSPCFGRNCGKDYIRCMYAVSTEEVYDNVRKLLPAKKAVFFDRDGTLCKDANYLNNWDDFVLLPGVDELVKLKTYGFELIGVSNQSGIGRGIVDADFAAAVNQLFVDKYGFTDFYCCPHLPEDNCFCRKPQPGMLIKARSRYGIDLKKSFVVGDKDADMLLAKSVGARAILVTTGQHTECLSADTIVDDLDAAMKYISRWKD
jgi:heptosyltransferase-2